MWTMLRSALLLLHGGGRTLEDLRQLRPDGALYEAISLQVPSADALGDWLRREGQRGPGRVDRVNSGLMRRLLGTDSQRVYTLEIDATFIEAQKASAALRDRGALGSSPMTGRLAETGLCVGYEFRAGNVSPKERNAEFFAACCDRMPRDRRIGLVWIDAAGFQEKVIGVCRQRKIDVVIRAAMNERVKWEALSIAAEAWRDLPADLGLGKIAETTTIVGDLQAGMRLIVLHRPKQEVLSGSDEIVSRWQMAGDERYFALVTSLDGPPADAVRSFNGRGQAENWIKELKIGYAMERMPCGEQSANAIWLGTGVLAYNLGLALKQQALGKGWRHRTVATLRWRLYQTAARLVRHAGTLWLRLKPSDGRNPRRLARHP